MALNWEGGLARLVKGLRFLGKAWFWGFVVLGALYLGLSGAYRETNDIGWVLAFGLVVAAAPAALALGLAWLLAGLLESKQ